MGSRFWPSYTVRTLALFAGILAIMFALGGLAQINPVWLYGPYDPANVTIPAQPDWYVAWGEGALRLGPPIDIHLFGHLIPSPFFPSVALGGVTFVLLYAWPFIERRFTGDRDSHQILDRPRDHPVRVAFGVYALTFFTLLVMAGGDDVFADWLHWPIRPVVWGFRIACLVLPFVTAGIAFVLARALQPVDGGFTEMTRADLKTAFRRVPPRARVRPPRGKARLEVATTPRDRWQWQFVDAGDDGEGALSLTGTEDYQTRDAALEAARAAFPDVAVPAEDLPTWPSRIGSYNSSRSPGRTITFAAIGMAGLAWLIRSITRSRA